MHLPKRLSSGSENIANSGRTNLEKPDVAALVFPNKNMEKLSKFKMEQRLTLTKMFVAPTPNTDLVNTEAGVNCSM